MLGLGSRAQSAAGVRPPRAPASAPDTAAAGKDPWIRRAVTGELPEPHAPSALLELSSLDPGLGARAQGEWRAASIARGSRRTRTEKRSGWESASVGHLVCLVQACVKGPLCYVMLCYAGVRAEGYLPAPEGYLPARDLPARDGSKVLDDWSKVLAWSNS